MHAPRFLPLPATVWLIALMALAVRLGFAAVIPLSEDEAYYRLWALNPSLGYLDHPPMVAWWMAPGLVLVPESPLGVRLVGVFAGVLATLLVADVVRRLGLDGATQTRAALWFNSMPLVGFGTVLATPDGPSTLFWALTLWALVRAGLPQGVGSSPGWWLMAGLAAGLGCLSKYTGLFLAPGVVLWLLVTPSMRAWLLRPWPWLAALVAVAVFSPNLFWNATNDWASLAKQFGRTDVAWRWAPENLAELIGVQIALISPLIAVFVVRAALPGRARGTGLIWLTSLPFIAYLVFHALRDSVQGNWPAPLYPAFAILAAVAGGGLSKGLGKGLARFAAPLGIVLGLVVLTAAAVPSLDSAIRLAPLKQLRGWPTFMPELEAARGKADAGWYGSVSYGTAAHLALYGSTPAVQITERARYRFAPAPVLPGNGLIVDLDRRLDVARLRECFGIVEPIGSLERTGPVRVVARYDLYRVANPLVDIVGQGCPALERDADGMP